MPELLSVKKVCRYLGISRATFYRLKKLGKIPKPTLRVSGSNRWDVNDIKSSLKVS